MAKRPASRTEDVRQASSDEASGLDDIGNPLGSESPLGGETVPGKGDEFGASDDTPFRHGGGVAAAVSDDFGIPDTDPFATGSSVGGQGIATAGGDFGAPDSNPFATRPRGFSIGLSRDDDFGAPSTNPFVPPPRMTSISAIANRPVTTGRKLVLLPRGAIVAAGKILEDKVGLKLQSAKDSGAAVPPSGFAKILPRLGVAVVAADFDQLGALAATAGIGKTLPVEAEDEFILYTAAGMDAAWLRGYRDAVVHVAREMLGNVPPGTAAAPGTPLVGRPMSGTAEATWGVLATRAAHSRLSGEGVKLAILDTGIDLRHPDIRTAPVAATFVAGESEQDGNGHGTHCAGVACLGGSPQATDSRYGVAGEALLHIAKVLNNAGQGEEQAILQGIEWALDQGCRIVSMSLSGQAAPSRLFEQVARRALDENCLLIAAAGNDSSRPSRIMPVGYPANCDSILAVAALDRMLAVARFSNRGTADGGGRIDISGPGVGVLSAWAGARRYKQESGTSMATPFVSGIAALMLQADPSLTAAQLADRLRVAAVGIPGAGSADIGAGLVQAPGS